MAKLLALTAFVAVSCAVLANAASVTNTTLNVRIDGYTFYSEVIGYVQGDKISSQRASSRMQPRTPYIQLDDVEHLYPANPTA